MVVTTSASKRHINILELIFKASEVNSTFFFYYYFSMDLHIEINTQPRIDFSLEHKAAAFLCIK